jgi:hypothetical protein
MIDERLTEEKTMKRLLVLVMPLAASVSWSAFAQGNTVKIPIQNPGFEADVLTCAPSESCYSLEAPGWLPAWFNGGNSGTLKPGTAQYPGGVPGAVNVAWLGASGTGAIFQTLPATLQPNTTYTLQFSVGHRADHPYNGYVATLLAGSTAVASDDSSLNPAAGTFLEDTITYSTGPTPALRGQLLAISIKSVPPGQVNIANVSLTATPE